MNQDFDRRTFLRHSGCGIAGVALQFMASQAEARPRYALRKPVAKRVVFIAMLGGVSQLDLFDYKPQLAQFEGKLIPESITGQERFANVSAAARVFPTPWNFQQHGQSGMWCSSLLPHFSQIVDDVCMVHSMRNEEINHPAAQLIMATGSNRVGRPSAGAWVQYGLGTMTDELPAFVVLQSGDGIECGDECFGNGFLPGENRGMLLSTGPEPMAYLNNPNGIDRKVRGETLSALSALNQSRFQLAHDPEIKLRTAQYEMAFRLQESLPDACDLKSESAAVHKLYGSDPARPSFAANCLQARRLLERDVRFVQLIHGGWDHHVDLPAKLPKKCLETDQAIAALVVDLKRRGLLEDTILVWSTEFGRTPILEDKFGRDHHKSFSVWLAGAGIKAGHTYGRTDDFGFHAAENAMNFHDLHATLLHLLGVDHKQLTFNSMGRDFRLTDVAGNVQSGILAN